MQELRATSASAGASLLAEHGVCWLDAALAPAALRGVADEAHTSFTALLTAIISRHEAECRGLPAHLHRLARMPVQCAEVVERDGGRFDCRYGCDGLPQLLLEQATLLAQLLEAVLGDELAVVAHGQVVALSEEGRAHYLSEDAAEAGAAPQAWHADGPHLFCGGAPGGALPPSLPAHALTVFLPLADVTEAVRCIAHYTVHYTAVYGIVLVPYGTLLNAMHRVKQAGPTEFALGTHRPGHSLPEALAAGATPTYTPLLAPAGGAVVFDYRVWHRGLPNRQAAAHRHVCYVVVARPWWRDQHNHLHTASIFGDVEAGEGEGEEAAGEETVAEAEEEEAAATEEEETGAEDADAERAQGEVAAIAPRCVKKARRDAS